MKNLLFLSIVLVAYSSFAQNPEANRTNIWYFGNGAGLDFSSGSPVPITDGALHSYEGGGSICDLDGHLLFYTDGDTVWTRLHQSMPNGTGLLGCGNYGSSAQNGLIVPKPGSETLYYIFTNDCLENFCEAGLRYSVVDMSLNGGLGDVTEKNIPMLQPSTEALAATKHANGVDYWLMGHEYNTNRFFCYLLSENGVSNEPVISEIGLTINSYINSITFSNKGDKLAMAYDNIGGIDQLFDFNNEIGILISVKNLSNLELVPSGMAYTTAFSPDDSKLYFMTSGNYVYQYCLMEKADEEAIIATAKVVYLHGDNSAFGQFLQGLDGKIYIASQYNDSLSVIQFPNLVAPACNLEPRSFYLGGRQSLLGLTSFVSSLLYNSELVPFDCDNMPSAGNESHESALVTFPNPSKGLIQIKLDIDSQGKVSVHNAIGQPVFISTFRGKEFSLDLSGLASGFYHLTLDTIDNKRHDKNIIIQKF